MHKGKAIAIISFLIKFQGTLNINSISVTDDKLDLKLLDFN